MPRFGIVGPSYTSQAVNAAAQMTMNWYPEQIEVGDEPFPAVMYPTEGTAQFLTQGSKNRGQQEIDGRGFFVADENLYEEFADGSVAFLGFVSNDGDLVSMTASDSQLLVESAQLLYVYNLDTATFTAIPSATINNVLKVDFCDGFFIALIGGTNTFRISGLFDATTWDALDFAQISVFPGHLRSMIVDHREIWLYGASFSTVYYNNGNADFPFVPNPSASVIEMGIAAKNSVAKLDNTIFWLGQDVRGQGIVWKASGYTPVRVTTHAIELAIQSYGDLSNAVAYTYQEQGHSFYVLYFPTPSKTWVYDIATNMWHERGYWREDIAEFEAHHSWNHIFCFGKHLVGDWSSGRILDLNSTYLTDMGNPIRRIRRAAHITNSQKRVFFSSLQVYLEAGLGATPPLAGQSLLPRYFYLADISGRVWRVGVNDFGLPETNPAPPGATATRIFLSDNGPNNTSWELGVNVFGNLTTTSIAYFGNYVNTITLATTSTTYEVGIQVTEFGLLQTFPGVPVYRAPEIELRWSNDGGHVWSNPYAVGVGKAGEYQARSIWRRLGQGRNRVFEISVSDPIPWRIVDCEIELESGSN